MKTKSLIVCFLLGISMQILRADTASSGDTIPTSTQYLNTSITLKILLVEFTDVTHRTSPSAYTRADFENLLLSTGIYVSPSMVSPDNDQLFGSMNDFFLKMSAGNLLLTGQIINTTDPRLFGRRQASIPLVIVPCGCHPGNATALL